MECTSYEYKRARAPDFVSPPGEMLCVNGKKIDGAASVTFRVRLIKKNGASASNCSALTSNLYSASGPTKIVCSSTASNFNISQELI
jgi:hypothetical protein